MHGLVRCKHKYRRSRTREVDVSFREVTLKIQDRGCDQGYEWRHAPEACAEIWEKSVSRVLPSEEEGWLKSFVPELRSRKCFRVSGFLCYLYMSYEHSMYVSHIYIWLWYTIATCHCTTPVTKKYLRYFCWTKYYCASYYLFILHLTIISWFILWIKRRKFGFSK